jgi:hypothetical protein
MAGVSAAQALDAIMAANPKSPTSTGNRVSFIMGNRRSHRLVLGDRRPADRSFKVFDRNRGSVEPDLLHRQSDGGSPQPRDAAEPRCVAFRHRDVLQVAGGSGEGPSRKPLAAFGFGIAASHVPPLRHGKCLWKGLHLSNRISFQGEPMNRVPHVSTGHALTVLIGAATFFATQLIVAPSQASAAEQPGATTTAGQITVSVASGRVFIGEVDPQTDRDLLWLRVGDGPIIVRRPIEWGRVVRVRQGEKEMSPGELRTLAHASNDATSATLLPAPPLPAEDWTTAKTWLAAPAHAPAQVGSPQVSSLQIDAELGHWTAGVETSGIVVCIHPTSTDGMLMPVDGTLAVDLIGQTPASQGQGDGLSPLGRWTQAVRVADFGPLGAVYQFPFQAVHPDFDLELRAHGLVHARLIVPGQGTFEASQAMVRLRPYSSVRDRLQQHTGSRFAPIEQTDR